ncbi:hypothetical protein ACP275_07G095700 [Erythranthe tilingii]
MAILAKLHNIQLLLSDFISMETREASPTHSLVKIESFYKSGIEKYETKEFVAGEYKWKLIICPNGDKIGKDLDYVSVNLAIADTSSLPANWEVNVVFSIFLFDQISAKYLCSLGITRRFLPMKTQWGFSKFISKKVMFEPSNGYLVDDTCVFGAEVFIVKKELASIECMSLRTFDIPYKRDWKIHNFSELGNFWTSGEFAAGGEKWYIRLYPKGYGKGVGSHISMFLYYVGSERAQASYTVCIKNMQNPNQHIKRTITDHVFSASDSIGGWGWPLFTELGTINGSGKGFLVDDSFLVHVEIFSVQDVPP